MDSEQSKRTEAPVNSWFGAFALLMSGSMAFFNAGVHYTVLGPIIPVLQKMYNQTYQGRYGLSLPTSTWRLLLSLTVSIMIAAAFLGGITLKIMLSFLTRKHLLQLTHVLNILGCLTIALIGGFTGPYEAVIIGRVIVGLPVGVYYGLIPLMVVEMSKRNKQAIWQSSASIAVSFGILCGPVLAHPKILGTAELWPIALAFPCVTSVLYLIASVWIPETPFYLVREGRTQDAKEALRKLRLGTDAELTQELNDIEAEVNKSATVVTAKEMFLTKQYRRQLIAVAAIYGGFMLTGENHLLFYTDQVFLGVGIPPEHVTTATIGINFLCFLSGFAAPKLVDRFGSLKVNKASTSTIIFGLVLFTISQAANHLAPNAMPYVALVAVAIYQIGFFAGTQLSTLVLLGEYTTEPTRPTALALGSIVLWTCSWTIGFIPPYLAAGLGAYAMTIWIGASILFLLFQIFYLPDTKGKSVDEIQAHFM